MTARDPAIGNPTLHHECQDQIPKTLAEKCHNGDGKQQRWKRPDHFNEFLDQKVNRAGKVSGNGAEPDADNAGDKHYRDGNDQ